VAAAAPSPPPARKAETRLSAVGPEHRFPAREAMPSRSAELPSDRPVQRSGMVVPLIAGVVAFLCLGLVAAGAGVWWLIRSASDGKLVHVTVADEVRRGSDPAATDGGESETPGGAKGQLSSQVLKDLKGATVFIKVDAGKNLSCSGSGFLVRVDGDAGYVVTNHHVVNPEAEMLKPVRSRSGKTTVRTVKYKAKNATITTVFHSGSKAERALTAEIIATDESRDLAVLRVHGPGEWPRPIVLERKAALVETMPVYILGFPFGEALSFNKGNPAITVNKGSVSSLRENEYGEMKAVQIDGAINPGNSGGPVVDEDGRLVGISVATIRGSGIGLAIAPDELTHLLRSTN
jgi:S1-C subfamily serine protease